MRLVPWLLLLALVVVGGGDAFGIRHYFQPPAEPPKASYVLAYDPQNAWQGVKEWGMLDVLGGQRLTGFIVVANDTPVVGPTPEGTTRRISDVRKSLADMLSIYDDFLDPSPPLPFALVQTAVIRAVEGGTKKYGHSSERIFVAPVEVLHRRDVEAWRFAVHPWNFTPDQFGSSPRFWRVLEAKPMKIENGGLVELPLKNPIQPKTPLD